MCLKLQNIIYNMIFLYSTLIYVYIIIDNIFIFYIFFQLLLKIRKKLDTS